MATTGFGRVSSINRIPYYQRSKSTRTYKGVKTGRMVADIQNRMQKAQDSSMKLQFQNGTLSSDQYVAYLTQRIAQTADPTYRETLTQELQNNVTSEQEKALTDGYSSGIYSAGQVADYYKNKMAGMDPNSPEYTITQSAYQKYNNLSTTDAYNVQHALLQQEYNGAADKLPAAQKMLDFLVQYSQTIPQNSPEYATVLDQIGTYQSEVRKLTFQQQLDQSQAKIESTYGKDTPENWNAKAQLYQQLRDAAAQQGDITNYYKYDRLASDAQTSMQKAQTAQTTKQIHQVLSDIKDQYMSGQISGDQAQQMIMQVADTADQNGDSAGAVTARMLFDTVQNDINKGVSYGGDNGFGKVKGGSGSGGVYDLSTGTIIGGSVSGGSSSSSANSGSAPSKATTALVNKVSNIASSNPSSITLDSVLSAAGATNPPQAIIDQLNNAKASGASFQDLVNIVRVNKVGTGDGWQALQDVQKQTAQTLNSALQQGIDPTTGLPFTIDDFKAGMLANNQALAAHYSQWQQVISANPNVKIKINGKNVQLGTLSDNVDTILNGKSTIDPLTGLEKKDTPGLVDSIATLSNPNSDIIAVEDPAHPGTYLLQSKVAFEQANGTLASQYIQDEAGVYHKINEPKPTATYFQDEKSANLYAQQHNLPLSQVSQATDGRWTVYVPNTQSRNVTVYGPNGEKIVYNLTPDNKVTSVQGTPGTLPAGFNTGKVLSFGGARMTVPINNTLNQQKITQPTLKTPANFSSAYGPRYATGLKLPNASMQSPNTSTRTGNVYTPPPQSQTPLFSPVPAKQPNFSPAPNMSVAPVAKPVMPQNPLDTLIANIIKPNNNFVPSSSIPANTPLTVTPQPQQQPQTNPASASAPLQIVGSQPQNAIQQTAQQNGQTVKIQGPSIPATNFGNSQNTQPFGGFFNNVGNALGNAGKAIGNFFGGFHL